MISTVGELLHRFDNSHHITRHDAKRSITFSKVSWRDIGAYIYYNQLNFVFTL